MSSIVHMSSIVANRFVEHLERCGFVVIEAPPDRGQRAALSGLGCAVRDEEDIRAATGP